MSPSQSQRYARQIRLPHIGASGQRKLLNSRALIIGMGGLGSPAAMYLATAGVGALVVNDFDRVEDSNLQRQIIHRHRDIGELKAVSAKHTLAELNPHCAVIAKDWQLDGEELAKEIRQASVVLDCCDNFATRFAVNRACVEQGRPLVSGAAIRMEGQIATYLPDQGPCYQCLYPGDLEHEETCAMEGILAPVVGIIGAMQALQAIQVLTEQTENLVGRLLLFDAVAMQWRGIQIPADPKCPICSAVKYTHREKKHARTQTHL